MRESLRDCWLSPPGFVAITLLVAQFGWRGYYLWGGYYAQDDFLMLRLGRDNEMTWSYLMQAYAGHVWPGNFLIAWVAARIDPMSWTLSATMVLLLQFACGALMYVVLAQITSRAWIRLLVLVIYLTCPLTLWATQWWASAIGFVPLSFFMLLAVWGLLRRLQDDWRWGSAVAVTAFVGGVMFQERALLIPILLGGLAVVCAEGGPIRRLLRALRHTPILWAALALAGAGWIFVHATQAPLGISGGSAGGNTTALIRDYFLRTLLPGLFGGPWGGVERAGDEQHVPLASAIVGSVGALLILGWLAMRSRTTGRLALLLLVVYAFADLLLLFGGRTQYSGAFGLVPRYAADVVPVLCVVLAFGLNDAANAAGQRAGRRRTSVTREAEVSAWRSRRGALVVAVALAYAASAVVSTAALAPWHQHRMSASYVSVLEADLHQRPHAVLYDGQAPYDVMFSLFGDDGRLSTVLANSSASPVFDAASSQMMIPNSQGVLEPIEFAFSRQVSLNPGEGDCEYTVRDGEDVRIAARSGTIEPYRVLKIGSLSGEDAVLTIVYGGHERAAQIHQGANTTLLMLQDEADSVTLGLARGSSVCITEVLSGIPTQALN